MPHASVFVGFMELCDASKNLRVILDDVFIASFLAKQGDDEWALFAIATA